MKGGPSPGTVPGGTSQTAVLLGLLRVSHAQVVIGHGPASWREGKGLLSSGPPEGNCKLCPQSCLVSMLQFG